jgi:glycerophosphoryl diester phosphodiesterase
MKYFFSEKSAGGILLLLALICAFGGGCALPPATRCLGEILQKEINRESDRFTGYRCTAGAHRGDSVNFTENTLAAIIAAGANPAYAFVEFDVQFSADGKIVVFHDQRLLRIFGSLRSVGGTSFEKLREVSAGEIAAYDDVMDALPGKKINIEIKSQGDSEEDARLADEIIADVRRRGREDDVMISAISGDVVKYISRKYPRFPTGQIFWLTASTWLHFDTLTERLYREIAENDADYILLHVANLRNIELLLALKPPDKTIIFWDFDDAIYLVHKHFSDRLWGQSGLRWLADHTRYMALFPFYRFARWDAPE